MIRLILLILASLLFMWCSGLFIGIAWGRRKLLKDLMALGHVARPATGAKQIGGSHEL